MLSLVRSEIQGLLHNPLTIDAKNSRHITGNFLKQIQMHLS